VRAIVDVERGQVGQPGLVRGQLRRAQRQRVLDPHRAKRVAAHEREVLMCSDLYAEDIPLRFLNTQLPPTRSDASKQPKSKPRWCSALAAAMPEEPAPITQEVGSRRHGGDLA
jgi:hypothetical protein